MDFTDAYDRFLKYIPEHGSIIDIGCGSGRDTAAFVKRGYDAVGLDASEKLAEIARREHAVPVITADLSTWTADEPFDGMWCCASLLHLEDAQIRSFFAHLDGNLKAGGAIYISVKSGIQTGFEEKGRYMRNFQAEELRSLLREAKVTVVDEWETGDRLSRAGFCWINVIGMKE